MSQENFDNEKEIRRFLLGQMSEDERAAFEERFIAEDARLFDEIVVAEDELIESFVRGTLSPAEKAKFEQHFLAAEPRRRRVAFTREMFDKLAAERESAAKKTEAAAENSPARNFWANLLKRPRFAFGAGFAILLLVFGFWFFALRNPADRGEIVRQSAPPPTVSPAPQSEENNQDSVADSNKPPANEAAQANKTPADAPAENPNKNQPPARIPKPVVASVALFPGTVRSEGGTSELNLTKDTRGANFQLNLESEDYRTYRAEIVDADGRVLYRSARLTPRGGRISVFFPTAKLKKGDYFVKLYGFNPAGAEESAADFQFRVNQK